MQKYPKRRMTALALALGVLGLSGLLTGCSSQQDDTPPPYKGQPGDKMPQGMKPSGSPAGGAAPTSGEKKSPD